MRRASSALSALPALVVATVVAAAACNGATVPTCDPAPGTLTGTCTNGAVGQCVDFAGLGTSDAESVQNACENRNGTWGDALCPSAGRVGTCTIPATDPNTDVFCSPNATIQLRYYAPHYDLAKAQAACAGAPGTTFTPG